ncbi:unnamed protein product [Ilex paraguariensis]|uniref:Uncharacterized protein n=1 Tax=Ilex paraguariensis TaxID=185542 RepID=A0ABC8U9N9_9AQUA
MSPMCLIGGLKTSVSMKLGKEEAFYAAGTAIVLTSPKARDISAVVWMVTTGTLTFLRDATICISMSVKTQTTIAEVKLFAPIRWAATGAVSHMVIRSITMQVDILDANLMEEGHHLPKLPL